jgi:hypothetical protein
MRLYGAQDLFNKRNRVHENSLIPEMCFNIQFKKIHKKGKDKVSHVHIITRQRVPEV